MKLSVQTLSDRVYDEVLELILSGRLAADAPIRQDTLALQLGVSKIPVREALARLESGGLVASHPHRGFVVRGLSRREAEEVFDLRLKLEPDASALGAMNADDASRSTAQTSFAALDRALAKRTADAGRRNREFHLSLVRPSGRDVTTEMLERLLALSERYVRVHLDRGRFERARREHKELLEIWLSGREAQVRRLVERHIKATLRDLSAQLDDNLS